MDNYYLTRGSKINSYNFDLNAHVKMFNFYDFCSCDYADKYGFLVIKPKTYLIGYNAGMGKGTHMGAFARVMKEELGGGVIKNESEAITLGKRCEDRYITANLINEYCGREYYREKQNRVYVCFSLGDKNVTDNMMRSFIKFYDDYNKEVDFIANHFGFKVYYNYFNNGITLFDVSNNLDNLCEFLTNKNILIRKRTKD